MKQILKNRLMALALLLSSGLSGAAQAADIPLTFVDQGLLANSARLLSADVTGLGITEIASITIVDDGTPVGGSPGIFSGFDVDGLFLDGDGDITTVADQVYASSFIFNAGATRATGSSIFQPNAAHPGPTFGSLDANTIDFPTATLDVIGDGINQANVNSAGGFLTLGDGGTLTAIFGPAIPITGSLFFAIAEQGGQTGEGLGATVFVSDTVPAVPLPAGVVFLVTALGGLGAMRKLRKA